MRVGPGSLWWPLAAGTLVLASLVGAAPPPMSATTSASLIPEVSATRPATIPTGMIAASDLADLDNDHYAIRQLASRRLLADNSLSLDSIAQGYAAATTLEQKHRLMEVARHHFIRTIRREVFAGEPLGSIGISIASVPAGSEPGLGKPAIRVLATLPGFPAYPLLQSGDLITAVNGGTPANGDAADMPNFQFQQLIQDAAQTGRPIRLLVVSDGEKREVAVEAAGLASLNALYDSRTGDLRTPVVQEWDRFRSHMESERNSVSKYQPDYQKLKESLLHPDPAEGALPPLLP